MKDIVINNMTIRISGNISEDLSKHIDNYTANGMVFDLYDFVDYVNKKKYIKGYIGGKETRKNNPFDYIIYI